MTKVSRTAGWAALMTGAALAFGAPAVAAPGKGGHAMCHGAMSRLNVTGEGEARTAPDLATIQLGVTTQAASAAEAMRQNSDAQTAVIEALAGAGIDQADVQTSGLNLNPVMDYGENRAPTVTGYQATNMVAVRVRDVARLGEVLDAIVAAGANEINGISFMREDASDSEDQARRAAVEDARHKAEVLAEAAGLTLGPVLVLRDAPTMDGPRPMMMEARAASDAAKVPIAAGEVAMTAHVEMEFALTGQDCGPMGNHRQDRRHDTDHRNDQDGLPPGHPPVPGMETPAPDGGAAAPGPVPGDDPAAPAPGDLPPPLGTDTGAPEPDELLVPMGETPEGQAPAN